MSWTTGPVTQNGNTTAGWIITGGALTNHDAIVTKLEVGSSCVQILSIVQCIGPNRYTVTVRVIGAGAVTFRFAAEALD
ncbi:MAG TPA: hypothetical protein VFY64_07190 [Nitrososphaeraceae archaeon]|nr:hypothetical protein [Nitrososphaeraceae archaeon]